MAALIRRVEMRDLDRLGVLHSAAWTELYAAFLSPAVLGTLGPQAMTALWHKFVTRGPGYDQYVAEIDGDVLGFVGVGPGREPGYELGRELYFIYVATQYRRSAIGKALLKKADCDYLWIADSAVPAKAFYRKQKYFPDSVRREGSLFGTSIDEIRMAR